MRHGFIKVGVGAPEIRVGDCGYNADAITGIMARAQALGVQLLVLPELTLTGATAGDLFLQDTLLDAAERALIRVAKMSAGMVAAVGVPLRQNGRVYNCVAVVNDGALIGVAVKSIFYGADRGQARHFSPAPESPRVFRLDEWEVPFGSGLLFRMEGMEAFTFGVEIGAETCAMEPHSIRMARSGAHILLNPSAAPETAEREAAARCMLKSHSTRLICAYAHANAGWGESTTDGAYGGHQVVCEDGELLVESPAFKHRAPLVVTEIDLQRLVFARRRAAFPTADGGQCIPFRLEKRDTALTRLVPRPPFMPEGEEAQKQYCERVLDIQAHGLARRLAHAGSAFAVIGVSGGLDSTLALLAAVRAVRLMDTPAGICAVTMPCFGTSARTRGNAQRLCEALGIALETVDITEAVKRHFQDIGQPEGKRDAAFENAQARERTQVVMDIANQRNGLVVGTGDLSELALGFATYNGDHMSMYGVNASVPKTLARRIVRHCADMAGGALGAVLHDIVDTPVSPELLPPKDGEIAQKTEGIIGPYELNDFFLYYFLHHGMSPDKIQRLAEYAFMGEYDAGTIAHWLALFFRRFFSQQFKRSCMPDGPQTGELSLSPRGAWHMPSDMSNAAWIPE